MKPARRIGRLRRWITWLANAWAAPAEIAGGKRITMHMENTSPRRRLA